MTSAENSPENGCSCPRQNPDGILLASEVFQTRNFSSISPRVAPAGISVSIVNDCPHAGQVLYDLIRAGDGFSVVNYHRSAGSALTSLPVEKPSIALIDIDLPGVDACKCVGELKPQLQQTQFVVLAAGEEDVDRIFNALVAGATGYVLKRAPNNELLAALKQIHAGGSPMSAAIAEKVMQTFDEQLSHNAAAELSPRENRILRLLESGHSCNEAAATLNIDPHIVTTYIRSIYEKLHAFSGR